MFVVPFEQKEFLDSLFLEEVEKCKVNISKKKTRRFRISNGQIAQVFMKDDECTSAQKIIEYLGFSYDGYKIKIKDATLNKFYRRMDNKLYVLKKISEEKGKIVGRKKFYKQYSHLGEANRKELEQLNKTRTLSYRHRNFFSYAYSAAVKMNEPQIKHQVSKHWKHIHHFFDDIDV